MKVALRRDQPLAEVRIGAAIGVEVSCSAMDICTISVVSPATVQLRPIAR